MPGILDPHLMVIRESVPVAAIYPPHIVYKIKGICILSNDEPDQCLSPCFKHKGKVKPGLTTKNRLFDSSQLVNKTWSAVKIASSTIKTTTQQAAALATSQIKTKRPVKNHRKIEKQILDEIHKIFDDSNSFYYCPNADFTNNLQRRDSLELDDRFFWNKHMLKDIIEMKVGKLPLFCFLYSSTQRLNRFFSKYRMILLCFQLYKDSYKLNIVLLEMMNLV